MANNMFISYSRQDSEFADKLAKDLRIAGVKVWIDKSDIVYGENWDIAVEDGLYSCNFFLIILSPVSVESKDVRDELNLAINEGKHVIPVIYKDCRIPLRIQRINYIDMTGEYTDGLTRLLNALGVKSVPTKTQGKQNVNKVKTRLDFLDAINKLAEIVRTTYGPKGHPVIVTSGSGRPKFTKDLNQIYKGIGAINKPTDLVVQLLLNMAQKTKGNSIKTSIILIQAIYKMALKYIEEDDASYVTLSVPDTLF